MDGFDVDIAQHITETVKNKEKKKKDLKVTELMEKIQQEALKGKYNLFLEEEITDDYVWNKLKDKGFSLQNSYGHNVGNRTVINWNPREINNDQ